MAISQVDIIIIIAYLMIVALIGSFSGGKQKSTKDYFMGGTNIPWWAVAFSIVAAETSSLTFISIPGLAYISNLNFLQLTIGYLIARIIIAYLFLPAYKAGALTTAYEFLHNRFGLLTRRFASITFLFTRIAADGVRLFSTAIPLAIIFKSTSIFQHWSNFQIYGLAIIIIAIVSMIYTYTGGVKGVIWADVLQMGIYIGGAAIAFIILIGHPNSTSGALIPATKMQVFNLDFGKSIAEFFQKPYTLIGALVGGTFLSMASHGTDQLIVQRLLTIKNLTGARKAIITSGILIIFQFTLFMAVGLLLYKFFNGISISDLNAPFQKPDEIFPYFIIQYLPAGIKGFIVAGLFAAAMSTLAGSMSSLSSSAMFDLYQPLLKQEVSEKQALYFSRIFTLLFGIILIFVALIFIKMNQSVVEVALGIASITYGGLLGIFLLGLLSKSVGQKAALIGFSSGIIVMLGISLYPVITSSPAILHWTWFVTLGTAVTIIVGLLIKK